MDTTNTTNSSPRHLLSSTLYPPQQAATIKQIRYQRLYRDLRYYLAQTYRFNPSRSAIPLLSTAGRRRWPLPLREILTITIARLDLDIPDVLLNHHLAAQRVFIAWLRLHPSILAELEQPLQAVGAGFDWSDP